MRWMLVLMSVSCFGTPEVSRQDVVEYLRARGDAERAAIVAEADAAPREEPPFTPEVVPVELDLPPGRPGVDEGPDDGEVTPVELDLPPRRPGVDSRDDGEDAPADRSPESPVEPLAPVVPKKPLAPQRPAAPVEPAPAPRPPAPPADDAVKPDLSDPSVRACTSHDDCGITCAMACCGAPCGCRGAYNRAFIPAIEKWGRRDCPAVIDCPAVGCAYEPAFGAVCRNGRCAPAMSLSDY